MVGWPCFFWGGGGGGGGNGRNRRLTMTLSIHITRKLLLDFRAIAPKG